jgi:hypothetical protein
MLEIRCVRIPSFGERYSLGIMFAIVARFLSFFLWYKSQNLNEIRSQSKAILCLSICVLDLISVPFQGELVLLSGPVFFLVAALVKN